MLPLGGRQTAHDLLREADTAMYRAKAEGRNGVALFETGDAGRRRARLTLERDLAQALENGELAMHLQLQVDRDGPPAGAELLMRWRGRTAHGAAGRVHPGGRSSGLIVPLGRWALRQACRRGCAGRRRPALPLSVNVSPLQFRQPDFVEQVRAVLRDRRAARS
jgi:EAL domain-containing protein (putative c-di-GMP-specific phosphodiesterase class I)